MAETSPPPPPPPVSSGGPPESESLQHYCYQCEKRVSIETQTDEPSEIIICYECKGGFVVNRPPSPPPLTSSHSHHHHHHHHHRILHEPSLSHHFLQVLRLVAQAARDDDNDNDAPPPPPPPPTDPLLDPSGSDDYLRIELDGWGANGDEEEDEDEEDRIAFFRNNNIDSESSDHDAAIVGGGAEVIYDDDDDDDDEEEDEEVDQYRHRERIRLQLRDMAARAASGRNRILDLDWAEILTGLEDNAIELRVEVSESDGYIGNPEDYVDEAGYEALLQNLAESDGGATRGPPPASKSAVSNLPTVEITPEEEGLVCAICKDSMPVGEKAKKLPCGHGYHGDCIIPWLGSRNSCPVCRFELPTEDPEYEEEKKKKNKKSSTSAASSISGSASAPSSSGGEE